MFRVSVQEQVEVQRSKTGAFLSSFAQLGNSTPNSETFKVGIPNAFTRWISFPQLWRAAVMGHGELLQTSHGLFCFGSQFAVKPWQNYIFLQTGLLADTIFIFANKYGCSCSELVSKQILATIFSHNMLICMDSLDAGVTNMLHAQAAQDAPEKSSLRSFGVQLMSHLKLWPTNVFQQHSLHATQASAEYQLQ